MQSDLGIAYRAPILEISLAVRNRAKARRCLADARLLGNSPTPRAAKSRYSSTETDQSPRRD
jgi:hypothetical protein